MRRLAMAALLAALLLPGVAASAQSSDPFSEQTAPDTDVDRPGPGEFAGALRYAHGQAGIGATDDPCDYLVYDYYRYQLWWSAFPGNPGGGEPQTEEDPDPDGNFEAPWVIVWCTDAAGFLNWLDGFQIGPEPPRTEVLEENARRRLVIPLPVAQFSPDPALGATQVVGIETWLWIDPADTAAQTASACIPETAPSWACLTITAEFLDAGFDMGDGSAEIYCDGPGTPYDATLSLDAQIDVEHCGHVFLDADAGGSTYGAVATTFWHVTWECWFDADLVGGRESFCGSDDLGVIGRSQAPIPLDVVDLQARAIEN